MAPDSLLHRRVRKQFNRQWYEGSVASYDALAGWYLVKYDDGDQEEVTHAQLLRLVEAMERHTLVQKQQRQRQRQQQQQQQRQQRRQQQQRTEEEEEATRETKKRRVAKEDAAPSPSTPVPSPLGRSEYERERDEQVARNKRLMADLGIVQTTADMRARMAADQKERTRLAPRQAPATPRAPSRRSGRLLGESPSVSPQKAYELCAEAEGDHGERPPPPSVPKRAAGKKAIEQHDANVTRPSWHGNKASEPYEGARDFVLPPPPPNVRRHLSCHCCTQCRASWRGAMSPPLACTTCGIVFCARCLFHITDADSMEDVYQFVQQHQNADGTVVGPGWSCFVCQGTCACQNEALRTYYRGEPGVRILCHKHMGWVGVSGGAHTLDASAVVPS